MSIYDLSTLYTTLPHTLIKAKLPELIKQTFNRDGSISLDCNEKRTVNSLHDLKCGHVRKFVLAHGIRISEILPWDRKSYLTHAI